MHHGSMSDPVRIDPTVVRWSGAAAGDRPLLVMLHGRGSNERDLFELVPFLPDDLVVCSLRAPIPEGPGYSWYPLNLAPGVTPDETAVNAAVDAILGFLDDLGGAASIGLLGFSQGAAMALQLLRTAPERFAYAIQLSGFVIEAAHDGDAFLKEHRPAVFWGRGIYDEVISVARVEATGRWLVDHSMLVEQTYATGHSVTREELDDVSAFVERRLSR